MRYFLDTEFVDGGNKLDLISIGIVCEDGRQYYAINRDYESLNWSEWLTKHVRPHIEIDIESKPDRLKSLEHIAEDVRRFFQRNCDLWCYFGAHDLVLLHSLYGGMISSPRNIPEVYHELYHKVVGKGLSYCQMPINSQPHNALCDAQWNKELYDILHKKKEG